MPLHVDHRVRDLLAVCLGVRAELDYAVKSHHIHCVERGFDFRGVDAVGIFDGFLEDQPGRIAACRVVGWRRIVLGSIRSGEIFCARAIPGEVGGFRGIRAISHLRFPLAGTDDGKRRIANVREGRFGWGDQQGHKADRDFLVEQRLGETGAVHEVTAAEDRIGR